MQKITPFLWFNTQVEEAIAFYCGIFPESKLISTIPDSKGGILGATFELLGQQFKALNGGADYTFNEAISFFVSCETQQEIKTSD